MEPLEEIKQSLVRLEQDVSEIKRGVYGDKPNKVKGLIELREDVDTLVELKKKIIWGFAGALVVLESLIHLGKLLFNLS
jgi:hypothetical protein